MRAREANEAKFREIAKTNRGMVECVKALRTMSSSPEFNGLVLAEAYAQALNERFGENDFKFTVRKGLKYHKIMITKTGDMRNNTSIFAFMNNDGNLYMAASRKAPAKGIRYHRDELDKAFIQSDVFGSFLYKV